MKKTTVFHTVIAGTITAALCACATAGPSASDQAITAAEAAIAEAKSHDWIWRDTETFLSDAKAAAEKGDKADAIKLADKARDQAQLAVKQYELEKSMDRSMQ